MVGTGCSHAHDTKCIRALLEKERGSAVQAHGGFSAFSEASEALEKPQEDEESSGAASSTAQPAQELGATRVSLIARCAVSECGNFQCFSILI